MRTDSRPAADVTWFKSSYSGANTTECVEAAFVSSGVLVRDSKDSSDAVITVDSHAWQSFIRPMRQGLPGA